MLADLRLEHFDCSPRLIDRFVDRELSRLDADGSGSVDLAEFTIYVSNMTAWMRSELFMSNEKEVFASLAGKAMGCFPPTSLPREMTS